MHKIALRTETALNNHALLNSRSKESSITITDAISQSVSHTAYNLNASAIIAPTESGYTARMIAKYRPSAPVVAVTSSPEVCRKMTLVWGVIPQLAREATTTDELFDVAVEASLKTKVVSKGDLVIISAGVPVGEVGTTNLLKVHVVGDVISKGQGIGRKSATGKVVIAKSAAEANIKVKEGDILVTIGTDRDMVPAMQKAVAVIAEEGGLTSHAAVVGLNLGIPVIVGVQNATLNLKDGQEITVDGVRGVVYNGHASVL